MLHPYHINQNSIYIPLLPHIAVIINSDFEDDHDSSKGEVNENVLLNGNAISDISKDTVVDKGVSLCLKSLRKTKLCRCILSI